MDLVKLNAVNGLDYKKALETLANMPALYEKILNMFLEKYDAMIEKLNTAEDGEQFTIEIHSFKSTLRNIGLFDFGDIAQDIETYSKAGNADYCRRKLEPFINDVTAIVNQIRNLVHG